MACHLSRLWTLVPLALVVTSVLPSRLALGQDGPNSSVAFVTDAPLTAQGPTTSGNPLRYSEHNYGTPLRPEGDSQVTVVRTSMQPQRSNGSRNSGGGLFGSMGRRQQPAESGQDDRRFKFPSLPFLGGSDNDDRDPPPQSSIAVVGGNPSMTGNQTRMVDPNVMPTGYREASRTPQLQTRQRSGGGGMLNFFKSGDDEQGGQLPPERQFNNTNNFNRNPGRSDAMQPARTMSEPAASKGLLNELGIPGSRRNESADRQQANARSQPPQHRPSHQLSPQQRQQRMANNMPRPIGVSNMSRQPFTQPPDANQVVTSRSPSTNQQTADSQRQHTTPRPSPSVARRESSPEATTSTVRSTKSNPPLALPNPQAQQQPDEQPAEQPEPESLTPAEVHARELIVHIHHQSQLAQSEDDFTVVVETCRRAMAVQPTGATADYAKQLCAWGLNRRGQCRADAGDNDGALLDFEDAVRLDTKQWRAVHNRGVLYAQLGKFEQAFDDFNLCTELNPHFAKAYSNRAALFVQAGDLLAALQDYRRAITLDPDLAVAHKGRGRVCHMLGSTEEALQHFDAAAQLTPNDAHVVTSRGDLLSDLGRYAAAAEEYRRAIELDDQLVHAYRSAAWLLATCPEDAIRDADLALEYAERAIEYDKVENPISLDTLAAAQANAGDFEAAVATIRKAIAIAPEEELSVYQARLALYKRAQPFRVKPTSAVATVSYDE